MKLNEIKPAKGSVKNKKRQGRGEATGNGGTAGRGHKGAKSRSGYSKKTGFEGGQMPLQRRVPKFGFYNRNSVSYKPINLTALQNLAEAKKISKVTPDVLRENGMLGKHKLVKILGKGDVKSKLEVQAHGFSQSAAKAIEKAGGSAEKIK